MPRNRDEEDTRERSPKAMRFAQYVLSEIEEPEYSTVKATNLWREVPIPHRVKIIRRENHTYGPVSGFYHARALAVMELYAP